MLAHCPFIACQFKSNPGVLAYHRRLRCSMRHNGIDLHAGMLGRREEMHPTSCPQNSLQISRNFLPFRWGWSSSSSASGKGSKGSGPGHYYGGRRGGSSTSSKCTVQEPAYKPTVDMWCFGLLVQKKIYIKQLTRGTPFASSRRRQQIDTRTPARARTPHPSHTASSCRTMRFFYVPFPFPSHLAFLPLSPSVSTSSDVRAKEHSVCFAA